MLRVWTTLAASFLLPAAAFGQIKALAQGPLPAVKAKIGSTVEVKLPLQLLQGFHINSNTPADKTLIPLKLTWKAGLLAPTSVTFPKPVMEKYHFSPEALSVFNKDFEVTTVFKVAPTAPPGPAAINGEVRYQACNDKGCQLPTTLNVAVQLMLVR